MAKSATRLEAERLCLEFPDAPSRTLAKKLSTTHKCTIELARSHIRMSRGNIGDKNRKDTKPVAPRPNQPAGWKPEMPPSLIDPWVPFDMGNGHKTAILSDLHVPFHSEIAVGAAVDYCRQRKPDNLLINGDFMDFYAISKYQKDPSKIDFDAELGAGADMFAWLRNMFPKARIIYKKGNHDERWMTWVVNNFPLLKVAKKLNLQEKLERAMDETLNVEKFGVEVVNNQRPVMVGKLPVLHGHELGRGGGVNPARWLFLKTTSTMMIGHGHRTSQHTEPDWKHVDTTCWTTGCLCDLTPEYARITKWNWGAAFVEVDSNGEFEVDNFRIGPSGEIWK